MTQETIKATVTVEKDKTYFEFGRVQGELWISTKGKLARALKLENGQTVTVTVSTGQPEA